MTNNGLDHIINNCLQVNSIECLGYWMRGNNGKVGILGTILGHWAYNFSNTLQ